MIFLKGYIIKIHFNVIILRIKQLIKQYSKKSYKYIIQNDYDIAEINKRSAKWVYDHEIAKGKVYKKYLKINTGLCAYFTYPSADPNALEIVQLGSDLISWLFLFDDEHGEGRVHVGENIFIEKSELVKKLNTYRKLLNEAKLPKNPSPFHVSLLDFVNRAKSLTNDEKWQARFAHAMGVYFDGCIEEYDYRRKKKGLDLDSYFNLRAKSIGVYPVFELITLYQNSNPFNMSKVYNPELLNKYKYHSALLCSWVNDIFSLEKELQEGEENNIVIVLNKTLSLLDYEKAREKAYEYNQKDLKKLEDILYIFRTTGELYPDLENFLYRLRHWAIGNLYWTICSGRYEIEIKDIEYLCHNFSKFSIPIIVQEAISKLI